VCNVLIILAYTATGEGCSGTFQTMTSFQVRDILLASHRLKSNFKGGLRNKGAKGRRSARTLAIKLVSCPHSHKLTAVEQQDRAGSPKMGTERRRSSKPSFTSPRSLTFTRQHRLPLPHPFRPKVRYMQPAMLKPYTTNKPPNNSGIPVAR
jgi:hypothetical protein